MSLKYSVQPLNSVIENAYHELLPHQDGVNSRGKLQWKYRDGPFGTGMISTATLNDKIVGMIGGVATRVRIGGHLVKSLQAIDTVVSPDARGQGCFVRMGQQMGTTVQAHGFDALYGFPNANAAPGWFGKLGWSRLGRAPFLFKPLRAGLFLRKVLPGRFDLRLSFGRRSSADVQTIGRFDKRSDAIWQRFGDHHTCGVDRTHDYLNWRLKDCPVANYDCLGLFEGDALRAYVATHTTNKHGGRIAYIMEALGDDTLPALIEDAIARVTEDGAEAVLAWCPRDAPNRSAYAKNGFWPLPRRFAPEIHFGGRALNTGAEALFASASWYLSYLDSDTV